MAWKQEAASSPLAAHLRPAPLGPKAARAMESLAGHLDDNNNNNHRPASNMLAHFAGRPVKAEPDGELLVSGPTSPAAANFREHATNANAKLENLLPLSAQQSKTLNLNLGTNQQPNGSQANQSQQQVQPTKQQQQQPPNQNSQTPKPRGRKKKIRTEPIRPICSQCEKQFSNQSALTKHKLTHSDERKFACQQCSKAFKRHDHLTGHMQTHSNRKPFNCTIHGCDKTYCDARSLRRHKENIHHIVSPKDNQQTSSQSSPTNAPGKQHFGQEGAQAQMPVQAQQNGNQLAGYQTATVLHPPAVIQTAATGTHLAPNHQQQQQQQKFGLPNGQPAYQQHSTTLASDAEHQPSHLLQRRIQRLNSDRLVYAEEQVAGRLDVIRRPIDPNHLYHQQHAFSADYASSQHFSFDFNHPVDNQPIDSNTATISMNNITDSGLGLNVHYEEQMIPHSADSVAQTPVHHQHEPHAQSNGSRQNEYLTPASMQTAQNINNGQPMHQQQQFASNEQPTYQQNSVVSTSNFATSPTVEQQPSHLVHGRTTQLSSDGLVYAEEQVAGRLDVIRRPQDLNTNHHQHHHYQHQQHAFSADYASTQHFSFDVNHLNTHLMDQPIGSNTIPHSADSISDSGLGLNVQYEQQLIPHSADSVISASVTHLQDSHMQAVNEQHGGYLTPTTLHPSTPTHRMTNGQPTQQQQFSSEQTPYQQNQSAQASGFATAPDMEQQPSHLLQRRIQRLNSDRLVYAEEQVAGRLDVIRRPLEPSPHQQHLYQQHAFSADYASTQHFSFLETQ